MITSFNKRQKMCSKFHFDYFKASNFRSEKPPLTIGRSRVKIATTTENMPMYIYISMVKTTFFLGLNNIFSNGKLFRGIQVIHGRAVESQKPVTV